MPYRFEYGLAIAVAVVLAMFAALQVADSQTLGLSRQALAWIGIVSAGLGVLQSFLPRVTKPPQDAREGLD